MIATVVAAALVAVAAVGSARLCWEAAREFHREGIARLRLAEARERASQQRSVLPVGPVNRRERSWS